LPTTRKLNPDLLIFDVDGVLVDVRGSFHRSTLQTVHFFTRKRVSFGEIQEWKLKGGFNDDWKLTTHWIRSLGGDVPYEEVKIQFMKFYWGANEDGNVLRERWLVPASMLEKWRKQAELAIFTGRTRRELEFTLRRTSVAKLFKNIVTMDDIEALKPNPEGLLRILDGRDPARVLYLGDNIDDAIAARRAEVPFLGVLPRDESRRAKAAALKREGALALLNRVSELDSHLAKSSTESGNSRQFRRHIKNP